jgi:hypothetical protein
VGSNSFGFNFSTLRAALYYAASTVTDLSQFTAASGGPATFRMSTSRLEGSWFNHFDTLDGIPVQSGVTVNLSVVVWDSSLSSDPLSSAAKSGLWGSSPIFQYTVETSPVPAPSDFAMIGLGAFTIDSIPEASSLALVTFASAIFFLFCHSKR